MSPKAQIPSHRKPRSRKMNTALRAGVTGGVMGTIALTAAAAPALASDKSAPAETVEMPTLSGDLESSTSRAAESMQASAQQYQLQEAKDAAATKAKEQAQENKEKAEAKARAEAKRKAEAKKKAEAAAQRASRSAERSSLSTASAPASETASKPQGGNVATVLNFLRAQVGKSYVLGATGPSAYDCSGLTSAAFKQVGIDLPRTSQPQSTAGTPVSLDNVQPGDILYWGSAGSAYHVAVYVGGGKFIGAQNSSTGIVERPMSYDQPTGAVRVL
ncbi:MULTISPECIES: C40 family peptidase [Streptomyces]|uniref:Glycoside hydrolase n=1 Tax=Streptomyces cacaoi TaxID=1898 RepID=A0A4Y3QTU1_STRCI|nr:MULTISPECIES: C40 family peptidase [Streptomyces]NNG88301.1 C40 family peptidase [Streptomyces cacaoi]GEB48651.1 glycoside hydrolase [Streptomyces cacaoi]